MCKNDIKLMNILLISLYYPPDMGGASNRAVNSVSGLLKQGYNVKVIAGYPHYPHGNVKDNLRYRALVHEKQDCIDIFRVWIPPLPTEGILKRGLIYLSFMLSSLFALPWLGHVDLVFYVSPFSSTFVVPGLFYSLLKKSPLVLDCGDMWPNSAIDLGYLKSKWMIKIAKSTSYISYRIADGIAPINNTIKTGIIKDFGINQDKVHVVELGVDTSLFKPLSKDPVLVEKENLDGKFVVMYSGILGPAYDFDVILKASRILEHYKDIIIVLRGDGELKQKITQQMASQKISNMLLWPKVSDQKMVAKYLNLSDVLILPMKNVNVSITAIPSKVYEFLACGKPVIVCAEGELANMIKKYSSGLVVRTADEKAFAEAILQLYSDRKLAAVLGENAREAIVNNFSDNKVGQKLALLFNKIIDS